LNVRAVAVWILAAGGMLAYNWWILLPLKPSLLRSPNELLSNLEVTGQPFAALMQRADVAAGVLLIVAFLLAGNRAVPGGQREWLGMMAFGGAGMFGGVFPEVCADGINAVCRRGELTFHLPYEQYLHVVSGIVEFAGITVALFFAFRRTRDETTRVARTYRFLGRAAWVAYPLLGVAYLSNRLGSVIEALFFIGFTVVIITQLLERTGANRGGDAAAPAAAPIAYRRKWSSSSLR
jgi:hypothetical protein